MTLKSFSLIFSLVIYIFIWHLQLTALIVLINSLLSLWVRLHILTLPTFVRRNKMQATPTDSLVQESLVNFFILKLPLIIK